MNRIDLAGRRAIITGGSSGIGFATAQRFVDSGATVVLWDINESGLVAARASCATPADIAWTSQMRTPSYGPCIR